MRRALVAATWALTGCVELEPADTDGGQPRAVLVGAVDIDTYCDIVGIREVVLRATQVGCEASGPCTLPAEPPTHVGDRYSCPATPSSVLLGVEVDAGGRYAVEAVAVLTTAEEEAHQCYAAPGETPPILVTTADVDAGAHIMLDATGDPCP